MVSLGLCSLLISAAGVAPAQAKSTYWSEFGWGLAAVGTNLFYFPTKLVYATMGGLTGGVAYALTVGNLESAQTIWSPALGGTWVVSPEILQGREPLLLFGESYEKGDSASP
jgi:hypothetical protein